MILRSEGFRSPPKDRFAFLADTAPSPEELLEAKQELELQGLEEEPEPRPSPRRAAERARLLGLLDAIPPEERDAIVAYYAAGQRQDDLAAREGMTQAGVQYRLTRAVARLQWMAGPGSLFTAEDLERDHRGKLGRVEIRALAVYWRTSSQSEVFRELGLPSYQAAWRLLTGAVAKLEGKYAVGFGKLMTEGRLLMARNGNFSGLRDFMRRRLTFGRALQVPTVTLVGAYERHALQNGRPWATPELFKLLKMRGAKPVRLRADWSSGSVRGWRGVGVAAS